MNFHKDEISGDDRSYPTTPTARLLPPNLALRQGDPRSARFPNSIRRKSVRIVAEDTDYRQHYERKDHHILPLRLYPRHQLQRKVTRDTKTNSISLRGFAFDDAPALNLRLPGSIRFTRKQLIDAATLSVLSLFRPELGLYPHVRPRSQTFWMARS
jgi:hypothetical protein